MSGIAWPSRGLGTNKEKIELNHVGNISSAKDQVKILMLAYITILIDKIIGV